MPGHALKTTRTRQITPAAPMLGIRVTQQRVQGPGPRIQDPGPVVEDERANPNPGQTNTQRCSGVGALDEDSNFSPTSLVTRDRRVPSATGTTQERTCGASALPGYWRRSR